MKFSDEMLMAYADGELDLVSRAEIEAAMAADPDLRRAVERHRALAARVKSAYQGVLDEPLPAKLASLTAAPVAAPVVELAADCRSGPRWPRPSRSASWSACS